MASERIAKLKCPRWVLILAVVCLVIALIGLIIVPVSRYLSREPGRSYVVMVDAGSSSSKLYVYSWPSDSSKETPADVRQEFFRRTKSKGVASYADEPHKASEEIVDILQRRVLGSSRGQPAIIPSRQHSTTPIYMGATAGLRLLVARDPTKGERLLARLRSDFSKLGLQVRNATQQMRTITGDEEALAGWISSNYLYNTLRKEAKDKTAPQEGTIGALDMGGASTQISFVTTAPVGLEVSKVSLYNRNFNVYQHSFLCFGQGQAYKQIYASLWVNAGRPKRGTNPPIDNPCAHKGYSVTMNADSFLQKPCFIKEPGTEMPAGEEKFSFIGTSNYTACRRFTAKLFTRKKCPYSRCSFDAIFQPPLPPGKFVAFSSYYFAMKFFNVTRDRPSRSKFQQSLKAFCSRDWNSVRNQYSKGVSANFISGYCFSGIYIVEVIKNLGFDDSRWSDISFIGKIGNRKMSWPLGYILLESDSVPPGLAKYTMAKPTYVGLVVFFVIILVICNMLLLAFVLSRWWGHRYTRANRDTEAAEA